MANMMMFFLCMALSYLIASVSSAVIFCKLFKLPDPRIQGSKNPGATNVLRLAGKKIALLVFMGDFLKGFLPVILAKLLLPPAYGSWIGLFAVFGHIYPLFFQFKGGKGFATALGVIFALSWVLGILTITTWMVVAILFRYASLATLVAILGAFVYSFWLEPLYLPALFLINSLIFYRHYANIQRLIHQTEAVIKL